MAEARKYSDADVRAILDRALSQSSTSDGLSHDDLLNIGEQVGVSRDALARAAQELHDEQLQTDARRAITGRRRSWLGYHAALFALVNALAFAINFFTTPGEWWSLFSIVPWAFALLLHAGLTSALPISEGAVDKQRQRLATKKRLPVERLRVQAGAPSAVDTEEPTADASTAGATTARRSP
jgi:2TM domain